MWRIGGLILLACAAHAQVNPPRMESRFAARDTVPGTNPHSGFWRTAPAVVITTDNFGKTVPGHRTEIRSRWTQSNLYLLFICSYRELNPHPNPSQTSETNQLWDWDVAEAFIGSDFDHIRRYREFEMSPQAEWIDIDVDLAQPHPAEGWTWNSGFQVASRIDAGHKTWYGVMRIPYHSIDRRAAAPGNLLRVNFYREQGPPARRFEISWQPTMRRSFHAPESFGILKLVP
jgi:hypothetical protein